LLLWTAGIFLPIISFKNPYLYILADQIYSTVCHQNSAKSFYCNENILFVCARCLGIYTGALILSTYILFHKKMIKLKINYLIISGIPMLTDVVLVSIGFYQYSHLISFITGVLFGSTVFVYILSVFENSFLENSKGNK
jgi:uncharacterized membrane protein